MLGMLAGVGTASGLARPSEVKGAIKITGVEADVLRFPPGRVISDAIHDFGRHRGGVAVRVLTDAGITGWAYSYFGMIPGGPRVVATILEQEIGPVLVGKDPAFPKRLRREVWSALEYHGVQGVAQFAIAAADIAIWDIIGKAAGLPVYRMLGAFHERMPAYSMCGWYYPGDDDLSEYRRSIERHLEEGFRAVKIKVGRGSLADDERRIRLAMDLCGAKRRVMVDANQGLNRNEALRRGRLYQEMGVSGTKSRCVRMRRTGTRSWRGNWTFASRPERTSTRSTRSWSC